MERLMQIAHPMDQEEQSLRSRFVVNRLSQGVGMGRNRVDDTWPWTWRRRELRGRPRDVGVMPGFEHRESSEGLIIGRLGSHLVGKRTGVPERSQSLAIVVTIRTRQAVDLTAPRLVEQLPRNPADDAMPVTAPGQGLTWSGKSEEGDDCELD